MRVVIRSIVVVVLLALPAVAEATTQQLVIGNFTGTLTYALADPSSPSLTNVTISANDLIYPVTVNLDQWLKFPGVTLVSADFRINMSGVDLNNLIQDLTPLVNAGLDAAEKYLNGQPAEALIPAVLQAAQPLLGTVTDEQVATLTGLIPPPQTSATVNTIVNPEPSTWVLLASGLAGAALFRTVRRKV